MAPELRINVNESEMVETWKDTVCSLCRIGGACPFIKEMVLSHSGVIFKITDDDTLGDYTSEFQSVLRACEEHLDKFTFSFLAYGLLIKFANEGGGNDEDKPVEETKDLTPHLTSVSVSDVGGKNRHKYVVDLKDGDGMDFYLKVVKDFDYPNSAVLYKKDNGLEISSCWMLRVFAGLLNDGDELVINYKYSSEMVRFHIDTYNDTFAYTLWASKQDTIGDIYKRALKLPNVVLSKLSPVFTAEADINQDAKKCSGELGEQKGGYVGEQGVVQPTTLETATKGLREEIKSDGKRTIVLMNKYDKPTITSGFRVFYLQGHLHISTAEGCYSAPDDILTTENVVLLNRDDKEDEEDVCSSSCVVETSEEEGASLSELNGLTIPLFDDLCVGILKLKVVGIGKDIIINFSYGKTTQAKEVFDFIDGLSEDIKGCYSIQWNTEEGASYLAPYDCLFSYLGKEQRMYLVIKIAGGAKGTKVIKVEKLAVSKSKCTALAQKVPPSTQSGLVKYDQTYRTLTETPDAISKLIAQMPLDDVNAVLKMYEEGGIKEQTMNKLAKLVVADIKEVEEKKDQFSNLYTALVQAFHYAMLNGYYNETKGKVIFEKFKDEVKTRKDVEETKAQLASAVPMST